MKPFISVTDLLILGLTLAVVIILLTNTGVEGSYHLYGGADADTLIGDPGDNLIWGGDGADVIDGSEGIDTLDYGGSDAAVKVNLADGTVAGGHATGDTITNVENIWGSAYDDILTGDRGNNTLIGRLGLIRWLAGELMTTCGVEKALTDCEVRPETTRWQAVRAPMSLTEDVVWMHWITGNRIAVSR